MLYLTAALTLTVLVDVLPVQISMSSLYGQHQHMVYLQQWHTLLQPPDLHVMRVLSSNSVLSHLL
jgi:hypothetical protein